MWGLKIVLHMSKLGLEMPKTKIVKNKRLIIKPSAFATPCRSFLGLVELILWQNFFHNGWNMWWPTKRSPSTWLTAAAARTMIRGARCVILLIASQAGTRATVVQSRASEQIQIRPPDNTLTLSHRQLLSPPCDEVTAFSADLWRLLLVGDVIAYLVVSHSLL